MAVVTRYSNSYPSPLNPQSWSMGSVALEAMSFTKTASFSVAMTNGDSVGSVYRLARLPSQAIIKPSSTLYCPGVAGATSISVGLDNTLGLVAAGALANAVNIAAGGSFSLVSAVASQNYLQRVWQLLGLGSDPSAMIDVLMTVNAAPTATGQLTGFIDWLGSAV
jgi:hypothetical protein